MIYHGTQYLSIRPFTSHCSYCVSFSCLFVVCTTYFSSCNFHVISELSYISINKEKISLHVKLISILIRNKQVNWTLKNYLSKSSIKYHYILSMQVPKPITSHEWYTKNQTVTYVVKASFRYSSANGISFFFFGNFVYTFVL